jgi:hypothetical protein
MSSGKRKPKHKIPPAGELRRSQVITTFGPGAMIDLPEHSVIVGGLDSWTEAGRQEIHEDRLVERLGELLGVPEGRRITLCTPPIEVDDPRVPSTGITCFTFPEWFVAQQEEEFLLLNRTKGLSRERDAQSNHSSSFLLRYTGLPTVEDCHDAFLEQVCSVQRLVASLQLGELGRFKLAEVPWVLLERPAGSLDRLLVFVVLLLTNELASRHGFDLGSSLGSEALEERPERFRVLPLGDPHHLARELVRHDGQVLVVLAVAQLVDPDDPQSLEAFRH